jgi:hypothetical protein
LLVVVNKPGRFFDQTTIQDDGADNVGVESRDGYRMAVRQPSRSG